MNLTLKSLFVSLIVIIAVGMTQGEEVFPTLSGVLPEVIEGDKTYLVVGDIFVSPGSTVTVQAGAVLLFESFTGMHVQGTLYARGSESKPVIFTSKNDSIHNAASTIAVAPFDWNGIDIYESAIGTSMFWCLIQYSVYGIRSQSEFCTLEQVTFKQNGKAHFTIKDSRQDIIEGMQFSYTYTTQPRNEHMPEIPRSDFENSIEKEQTFPSPAVTENPKPIIPDPPQKRSSPGALIIRYTGLVIGVGGFVGGAWYLKEYLDSRERLEDLSSYSASNMVSHSSKDWNKAKDEYDRNLLYTIAAGSAGVLGLLGFSISFAF